MVLEYNKHSINGSSYSKWDEIGLSPRFCDYTDKQIGEENCKNNNVQEDKLKRSYIAHWKKDKEFIKTLVL